MIFRKIYFLPQIVSGANFALRFAVAKYLCVVHDAHGYFRLLFASPKPGGVQAAYWVVC
jgi:hypothetical protein